VTDGRALPLALAPLLATILAAALFALQVAQGGDRIHAFTVAGGLIVGAAALALAVVARPAWTISIGLALALFSSHWSNMGIPLPLDRGVLGAGIVTTLVREWRDRPGELQTRPIDWLLALVALWAIGSSIVAGTIDDSTSRFALLDSFSLMGFALFLVAPMAFREARDRQVLLGVLVAVGLYLGLDAVIETTGPRGILIPRYIDDPTVGIHFDRARGPLVEATGNGLVLYACGVAAAIAALTWRDRRLRGLALVVVLLCALGALLTVTRAVWLAAVISTIVALLAARETRRWAVPAIAAGGLVVVIAFAVIPGLEVRAEKRRNDDQPLWDRKNSNSAALRMIAARPTLGFGWGRFPDKSPPYYEQSADFPLTGVKNVHNVFLANAVELGLVGAALWAIALLSAIVGALLRRGPPDLRPWRIGLIAVFISWLVAAMTTPLGFTLPTLLLWTWAGLLWNGKPIYATD
jgi:putative inorganic carbon (hco3(-)) transporter